MAIFGAAKEAVMERVKFLESEIKIDPSTIYLLSGQGPLWPMQEEQ
jgi:hypothetical protein